ncbi:MAG TPA: hypothetical protein VLX92_20135 [Kofleriaceae bacterium]|nr:hypothetical protein [Kofleriaceae bacterium]
MGFGIDHKARARKRLLRRAPPAREVGDRLGWLVRRMARDLRVRAGWTKQDEPRYLVELELHPVAPHAKLTVEPDGRLRLRAQTSVIGPGYHAELVERLDPILAELDYEWEPGDDFASHRDPERLQRQAAEWLAGELRAGARRIDVERPFVIDAPVLTMLGPRDAAWRDAVLADPLRAADAFPHWQPSAPGHAERARALIAMWHDVPWREPLDGKERRVMKRVDADLHAARTLDAKLDLPWPEWAELLGYLGKEDEEVSARAGERAGAIGYRRFPLELELSGGWSVALGGNFVGRWEDDGERYWATDGERVIEFSSLTANDDQSSEALLAIAPEQHPVIARRSEGELRGRAEAYDDGDVHIVVGITASAPNIALATFKGGVEDEAWALATWRTLRH